tara:strand:- start:1637 stop:2023 length:387 start_codon:yes stop_codon:yes gene_type:complete
MTKVTDNHLGGQSQWAEGDIELDPLCFKDAIALAVTNKGVLIPCCRMDDPHTMNDPRMQQFLKVSVINENNSIEDILKSKEWKEFADNLSKNIGPNACRTTCAKQKKYTQVVEWVDTEKGETKHVEKK